MGQKYDRKEVEEILRRAVRAEVDDDGIAHEDLVAAAGEVGIGRETLERAAEEVAEQARHAELVAAVTRKRKRRFWRRLGTYAVLSAAMFGLNRVLGGELWAHWVAFGFGVMALMRGVKVFLPSEGEMERAVAVEARQRKRRSQAQVRRAQWRQDRAENKRREADFERLLARGVDVLLRAADEKLTRLDTRPGERVRVETDASEDVDAEPPTSTRRTRR